MSFCIYVLAIKHHPEDTTHETIVDMCLSTHFYSVLYAVQQSCAAIVSVFVSQCLNYDDTQNTLAQITRWILDGNSKAYLETANIKIVSQAISIRAPTADANAFFHVKALLQLALKRH
jgi:hypothetical protein